MDQQTFDNWVKIKKTLEESGKTNNHFYLRACHIIKSGGRDLNGPWNK